MEYLVYLPPLATIITAIITAIIGGIFDIIVELIKIYLQKKYGTQNGPTDTNIPLKRKKVIKLPKIIVYFFVGGISGFLLASNFTSNAGEVPGIANSIPAIILPNQKPLPTPIEYGSQIIDISFDQKGDGICNDYGADKLGYENNKYYIQPSGPSKGRVAICHTNDNLLPQGALQISAFPEMNSDYFGYGVLFGWKGGGVSTTDACMMGIRKSKSQTEAVFVDWIAGEYKSSIQALNDISLDDQPHTMRVVINPNGLSQGYLDGIFFAEHQFIQCDTGPIGMVAWSSGHKIYFDDLKLFTIP